MAKRNRLLRALIDALFSKVDTVQYPYGPLSLPEGFRGAIEFIPERCTGCGLCVRDCPANGLELIRESREDFQLWYYPARCAYCGQCQLTCPREAISHSNHMVLPTTDPEALAVLLKAGHRQGNKKH